MWTFAEQQGMFGASVVLLFGWKLKWHYNFALLKGFVVDLSIDKIQQRVKL